MEGPESSSPLKWDLGNQQEYLALLPADRLRDLQEALSDLRNATRRQEFHPVLRTLFD